MESKAEQNIDRIKLLENHINELKSIISNFFEKKGKQFREIKLFKKSRDNKNTETIDDLDIHCAPVIIDFVSLNEFREKIDNLETKLNSILEIVNNKTIKIDSVDELRDMISVIKEDIHLIKNDTNNHKIKMEDLEKTISQIESGVICFE